MTTIFHDQRFWAFAETYHADPLGFCVSVCGLLPSQDQEAVCWALIPSNAKVSIVSGTGTGKTALFARLALWHLLCHPVAYYDDKVEIGSNTYIGAPRIKQVADGVWKEIADTRLAIAEGPYAWLNGYYQLDNERVTVKGFEKTWFIRQVALQQGAAIGVAGKHRYWQLIIIDEAAGVSDEHFDVIDGTQTQGGNRTLLASQGVRNSGRFFDTHHGLCLANGGAWASLRFSSERSPFVSQQWLHDRAEESGGRQSSEYRIRALGHFADHSGSNLLTRAELERAFTCGPVIREDEPYGLLLLADIGMGEYRDDSVAVVAKVIGYGDHGLQARRVEYTAIPYCTNSKDEITFAGDLVNLYRTLSNPTLLADNGGIGGTVNKLIEASGVPVVKVNWGQPCFKIEYQNRFYNRRACAMVRFRDAVRDGRVAFGLEGIEPRLKAKLLLQGSRLPYHFAEVGGLRYVMQKKHDMRKNGISSPDIIDAMAFAFLEDAVYRPAQKVPPMSAEWAKKKAEVVAMFADLVG
ncbi:MAG: hypothetical protein PHU14_01140 [Methylovulum sp.]|nr:hypothetical protein [Methylovulum sp.]